MEFYSNPGNMSQQQKENSQKIVRFTNIADFDFTSDMGAMYGGQPFPVKSGETKLFTYELGDHLATHLARQMYLRKAPGRAVDANGNPIPGADRPLWTDADIVRLKGQILKEAYVEEQAPPQSELERLQAKINELNKVIESQGTGPANTTVPGAETYKDKSEVIAELTKRGIKFDARKGKAALEELLKA